MTRADEFLKMLEEEPKKDEKPEVENDDEEEEDENSTGPQNRFKKKNTDGKEQPIGAVGQSKSSG